MTIDMMKDEFLADPLYPDNDDAGSKEVDI